MKNLAALTLSLFLTTGTVLADTPKDASPEPAKAAKAAKAKAAKTPAKTDSAIAAQLEELREALQSQQEQLQLLKEELAKRDRQIDEAREAAAAANSRATEASAKATEAVNTTAEVKSTAATLNTTVSDLKASNEALKTTVATEQAQAQKAAEEGPNTIHYKGVNITPGGFVAAETVYRHHATSGDINTPFTGIPYPGNSLAQVSELNLTGRQTRATLLAESKVGTAKVTGYFEMDFLGAGTTSNNRQSNSYVFRQRQLWAQAAFDNGWSASAGQMWSMATENKKGIQNRQEALPAQIDPQYVVGFTWQRAYGFRVVKDFGGKLALGISVEGPQTTIGGRGFSSYSNTQVNGTASSAFQNFWLNAPGAGGGLYNAFDSTGYTTNEAPDIVLKAALDPGWGHYEVFAIASTFRNRIYPCAVVGTNAFDTTPPGPPATTTTVNCAQDPNNTNPKPSALGAINDSHTGGGFGASFSVPLFSKKVDFGVKAVAGDGIGRFGSAQLPDATARTDGSLALIRTEHALGKIELHPNPKLDIYIYGGNEYAWRAGYSGYTTIKITNTPAVPGCGAAGQPACPGGGTQGAYPATFSTSINQNGIGGYGSPLANNTGCSLEVAPAGTSAPGGGGKCDGDIRNIVEGTLGFWHKFYQGPKGGLRWGVQYSYFEKWGWSGSGGFPKGTVGSISPKAVDNMFLTSFRYYLP